MKKILIVVLIGITAIAGGMLLIRQSSKPHYDHYVEVGGKKLIKIDWSAPSDSADVAKQVVFLVPPEFAPVIASAVFVVHFQYPSKTPRPDEGKIPQQDVIRVVVRCVERRGMRSDRALDEIESKKNYKSKPHFIGRRNDLDVYQYDYGGESRKAIGTMMVYKDKDAHPVVVEDPGEWSKGYDVARSYNDHIELRYQIDKRLGTDFKAIDEIVLEVVKSFQPNS